MAWRRDHFSENSFRQFVAVGGVESDARIVDMGFDGAYGDDQFFGYLFIG